MVVVGIITVNSKISVLIALVLCYLLSRIVIINDCVLLVFLRVLAVCKCDINN